MKLYLVLVEKEDAGFKEHNIEMITASYQKAQEKMNEIANEKWFQDYIEDQNYFEKTDNYVKSNIEYNSDWCDITIETVDVDDDDVLGGFDLQTIKKHIIKREILTKELAEEHLVELSGRYESIFALTNASDDTIAAAIKYKNMILEESGSKDVEMAVKYVQEFLQYASTEHTFKIVKSSLSFSF